MRSTTKDKSEKKKKKIMKRNGIRSIEGIHKKARDK